MTENAQRGFIGEFHFIVTSFVCSKMDMKRKSLSVLLLTGRAGLYKIAYRNTASTIVSRLWRDYGSLTSQLCHGLNIGKDHKFTCQVHQS